MAIKLQGGGDQYVRKEQSLLFDLFKAVDYMDISHKSDF